MATPCFGRLRKSENGHIQIYDLHLRSVFPVEANNIILLPSPFRDLHNNFHPGFSLRMIYRDITENPIRITVCVHWPFEGHLKTASCVFPCLASHSKDSIINTIDGLEWIAQFGGYDSAYLMLKKEFPLALEWIPVTTRNTNESVDGGRKRSREL